MKTTLTNGSLISYLTSNLTLSIGLKTAKKVPLCCACVLVWSVPAWAGILGDTFQISWYYPNNSTVIASTTLPVNPVATWNPDSGVGDMTLTEGTITIANNTIGWSGAQFNGFKFTDLSQVPGFNSFTLVSVTGNVPPLAPALSFDADNLSVNFTPTGVDNVANGAGQLYTFAFTETVPEPATLDLAGLGGLAAWVVARRRK